MRKNLDITKLLLILTLIFSTLSMTAQSTCSTPENKQLDFLIGDWEFYTPSGKLSGTSHIKWTAGTCSIEENWEGADGLNSHSILSYDVHDKVWSQVWTDEFGNTLYFSGQVKNGRLFLKATSQNNQGKPLYHRLTYYKKKNGIVGQSWKTSVNKKKWETVFDGVLKKKKPCL